MIINYPVLKIFFMNNNNSNVGTQNQIRKKLFKNKGKNKFAKSSNGKSQFKVAMDKLGKNKGLQSTSRRRTRQSGIVAQFNNARRFGYGKAAYMEPHTMAFAHVYLDPFTTRSARIPHFPVTPTQLVRNWVLTSGLTNSNGVGWVVGRWANGVVNDLSCMVFSAGPACPAVVDVAGTDTSVAYTNSQYAKTAFETTESDTFANSMRLVGVGCRVAYDGSLYNESGRVYAVEASPRNQSVNGWQLSDVTTSTNFKQATYAKRGWMAITRNIDQEQDFSFQQIYPSETDNNWGYINTGSPSMDDQYNWIIYITGAPPNSPFSIEYSCHFEMNGFALHQKATTVPNETGVGQVISSKAHVLAKDNTTPPHLAQSNKASTPSGVGTFIERGLEEAAKFLPETILSMF